MKSLGHASAHGTSRRERAIKDFQDARMSASLQEIASVFTGRSVALLSYAEVAEKLRIIGQAEKGRRSIPVESIIGSVGRYNDFTRTFLPKNPSDKERWAGVRLAAAHVSDLPPIEVYQLGEAFFVVDGNHRVSIARRQGIEFIDAHVTEVQTRVALAPDDDPYAIIIKAEYARFLEETALDKSRPGANFLLSLPGQYDRLAGHIEVHRYFMKEAAGVDIPLHTAAGAWYDDVYLPIVVAIREQGILRHFPNRTEADFYLWVAANQADLQKELGWDIRPEVAVTQLAARFKPAAESRSQKMRRRVLKVMPGVKTGVPAQTWSQSKILARYSDRLFADILLPLTRPEQLAQMQTLLPLIKAELAQLFGLHLAEADDGCAAGFDQFCQATGVSGALAHEPGEPVAAIGKRAALADLVAISHHFPGEAGEATPSPTLIALLQASRRPILVLGNRPVGVSRSLLVFEDTVSGNEALFIAAYLLEQHGCGLTVLTKSGDKSAATARQYLTMHEIDARFLDHARLDAESILRTADQQEVDLIILPGISRGRLGRDGGAGLVESVLAGGHHHAHDRPVLIGP